MPAYHIFIIRSCSAPPMPVTPIPAYLVWRPHLYHLIYSLNFHGIFTKIVAGGNAVSDSATTQDRCGDGESACIRERPQYVRLGFSAQLITARPPTHLCPSDGRVPSPMLDEASVQKGLDGRGPSETFPSAQQRCAIQEIAFFAVEGLNYLFLQAGRQRLIARRPRRSYRKYIKVFVIMSGIISMRPCMFQTAQVTQNYWVWTTWKMKVDAG